MPEVASQPNISQVITKKAGFNWKSVLIAGFIGAVVIVTAVAGLSYYINQNQSSLETGSVTIKTATPSAKTATSSAKPDETAGWMLYRNDTYKFSLQHPKDWVLGGENQNYIEFKKGSSSLKFMLIDPGIGSKVIRAESVKVGNTDVNFSLLDNGRGVVNSSVADYTSIHREGSIYTVFFFSAEFGKVWPEVKAMLLTFKFLQ